MNKKNNHITLKDIIDFVDLYVRENSVEANYDDLWKICISRDISTYTLNLLIRKVKEAQKNVLENRCIGLLPVIDTMDEKKKVVTQIKTKIVYKRNNKFWIGSMLFLIIISVILLLAIVNRNSTKIASTKVEIANYLMTALDSSKTSDESFPEWNSINKDPNSISKADRIISVKPGDIFCFNYEVSSEYTFDWLTVYVHVPAKKDSVILIRKSGLEKGEIKYRFEKEGIYKFTFMYSKDGSLSRYKDKATVKNVILKKDRYIRLKEKVDILCNELKNK